MKNVFTKGTISASALLLPVLVFAQQPNLNYFTSLINSFKNIVNTLIPIVVSLAVLVFLWGLFTFLTSAGDDKKRDGAKKYILWGIVIFFVMVSLWGIVSVLGTITGVNQENAGNVDLVPTVRT